MPLCYSCILWCGSFSWAYFVGITVRMRQLADIEKDMDCEQNRVGFWTHWRNSERQQRNPSQSCIDARQKAIDRHQSKLSKLSDEWFARYYQSTGVFNKKQYKVT